jgi:hypothetical protein
MRMAKSGKTRKKLLKARKRAQARIVSLRSKITHNAKPRAVDSVARQIIKENFRVERLTKSLLRA